MLQMVTPIAWAFCIAGFRRCWKLVSGRMRLRSIDKPAPSVVDHSNCCWELSTLPVLFQARDDPKPAIVCRTSVQLIVATARQRRRSSVSMANCAVCCLAVRFLRPILSSSSVLFRRRSAGLRIITYLISLTGCRHRADLQTSAAVDKTLSVLICPLVRPANRLVVMVFELGLKHHARVLMRNDLS